MSNIIVSNDFSKEQISLIKRTLLDNEKVTFSNDELALFINQCKRTGLDPFTRQIYATKNQGKVSIQATIDGLRLIAERSNKYAGQTRPTFFDADGKEYKVWPNTKGTPYACEIGILRHDFKEPVYAIAIFDEYAQKIKDFKTGEQKLGFMWAKMPALMLSKVAEALALRKAFPNDLSGIYSSDEIASEERPVYQSGVEIPQEKPETKQDGGSRVSSPETPKASDEVSTNSTIQPTAVTVTKPLPNAADLVKIDFNQANDLKLFALNYGYSVHDVSTVIAQLTNKASWSDLNQGELEIVREYIEQNKKVRRDHE